MSGNNLQTDGQGNIGEVVIELGHVLAASGRDSSPEAQQEVLDKIERAGWNVTGQQEEEQKKVRQVIIGKKGGGDRLTPEHR